MLSSQSFSRPHPFLPLASRCRQPLVAADSPCYRRPPPPPIHTTANTKTPPAPRLHHHKHHPLPLCHLPPLPLCRQCYGIDRHSTVADIASRTPPPSKIDIEIIRSYYETPEGFRGRRRECLGKYATDLGHMRATDTHRIGFPTAGLPHVCDEPAAKYALRCGFVAYGCRIRTEACPPVRVRLTRASDVHRIVSPVLVRRMRASNTHRGGRLSFHMSSLLRSAGPLSADLAAVSQDQLHTHRDTPKKKGTWMRPVVADNIYKVRFCILCHGSWQRMSKSRESVARCHKSWQRMRYHRQSPFSATRSWQGMTITRNPALSATQSPLNKVHDVHNQREDIK